MSQIRVEINFLGLMLLFAFGSIFAILAGVINLYLGITAFTCLTIFLLGLVWILLRSEKEP